MKRNNDNRYSHISSFEDFRREKEMLILRGKIIDAKLSLTYMQIRQTFSASGMLFSLAKEFILPKISKFFGDLSGKVKNDDVS